MKLKNDSKKGSKVDVAAAIFSIYGYESLKIGIKRVDS